MFRSSLRLVDLFGFTVRVDASWIFIALLVTWSLAVGFFPQQTPSLSPGAYWLMGIVGAAGLFISIVYHELCHSLVARRFGLEIRGITLFVFGGVAEMQEEPRDARTEFWMAVAGPAASFTLGVLFYLAYRAGHGSWPPSAASVLGYLAFINWALAGFNLVPAFPLDGGRVLRSALWYWKKDLRKATRIASRFGSGFAAVLIFLGVLSLFTGNVVGGIWYSLLGMFLHHAAQMAYRQALMREAFEEVRVENLMVRNPVTVDPALSLQDLADDYIHRHHYKMYPVVEQGRLVGCVHTRRLKDIPREQWPRRRVSSIAARCGEDNAVPPGMRISRALAQMNRSGSSRLMVVEGGSLVGMIALKDILGTLPDGGDLQERQPSERSEIWRKEQ